LNQCIHNGFGLHTFNEELTGPEYADKFARRIVEQKIEYRLSTMVIDIALEDQIESSGAYKISNKKVTAISKEMSLYEIQTRTIILAMGCRERPKGALNIPGTRPAGIYSAGTAQRLVNREGVMPGKEVVILGSGDIGLIMARRMTLEGANVKVVSEIMPYSGGLKRNIVQCLDDYNIPLKLSHTVIEIKGKERVEGVTLAQVDKKGKPIIGTEQEYTCDTLLLSVGLIPENELSNSIGIAMNDVTKGALVSNHFETNISGIFACGNVLHVHDLVDFVSQEAAMAGKYAAQYIIEKEKTTEKQGVVLHSGDGVRYTVPTFIEVEKMESPVIVRFRVTKVFKNAQICVYLGEQLIFRKKRAVMAPGEMEEVKITKDMLQQIQKEDIYIRIEEVAHD
ncbi:MAG: FAD-dependent oxidoreductase, partial [Eubacteriales bacterium]